MNTEVLLWATLRGKRFCFHTDGQEIIDAGTDLLVEHMNILPTDVVLDFSCGYGAKGIVAASLATKGHVHMVDASSDAVVLTQENAKINYVKKRIEAYVSDGFASLQNHRTFHAILFVMPDGMKKDALAAFIKDAKAYVKSGGKLYIVTPAVLRHVIKNLLENEYGNYKKVATKNGYMLSIATK